MEKGNKSIKSDKRKRLPAFPLLGTVLGSFPSYGTSVFKPFLYQAPVVNCFCDSG